VRVKARWLWPALGEKTLCLRARRGYVVPEAGDRRKLALRRRHGKARPHDAADEFEEGRALHAGSRLPPVDRQRKRATDPRVIEGRLVRVEHDHQIDQPGRLADIDFVPHRLDELVALGRGHAAEFREEATLLEAVNHRCAGFEMRDIAVEIRTAWLEVVIEALPRPVVALDVLDEDEGSGSEDMGLGIERVLLELRGAVDAIPGRSKIRQHRRLGPAQMEDDRPRIGSIDAIDRRVVDLSRRDHALGRVDDTLIARLDVGRGQMAAVVEEHVGPQPEAVGKPIGRHGPAFRQIACHLRVVGTVEFEQGRIVRCDRVHKRKRDVGIAIVVAGLGVDREIEDTPAPGLRLRGCGSQRDRGERQYSTRKPESRPQELRGPLTAKKIALGQGAPPKVACVAETWRRLSLCARPASAGTGRRARPSARR
jgi:hypothetical protein